MVAEQIAILDFGSQYTHLIARRIRQHQVLAKIHTPDVSMDELSGMRGIIFSGGPQSVSGNDSLRCDPRILESGIPILGLCYGHQMIADMLGGKVRPGTQSEYGKAGVEIKEENNIFRQLPERFSVWMSHGDSVAVMPKGFRTLATSDECSIAAMGDTERHIYGLQFHPEVTHTEYGMEIIDRFIFDVCHAQPNWDRKHMLDDIIQKIRKDAGERNVFLLVSGGVDSVVSLALLDKALGRKRVLGLHIDHGFLRANESQEVMRQLSMQGFDNVEVINATDTFARAVRGMTDPEEKRKRIGRAFLRVKDQVLKEKGLTSDDWLFAQGTIYPDTIESGATKHSQKIKTHHNRVDEIQKMIKRGQVIEPIADLYKDEVREIGAEIRLPENLVQRHPFPGPGLAIRVLCSDGNSAWTYSRKKQTQADLDQIIKKYNNIYQGNVRGVVLPIQSVGVQGDQRTYRHPVVLDGDLDWEVMLLLASDITNRLSEVNRALVHCGGSFTDLLKAEVHQASLTPERLHLLRLVDSHIDHAIRQHDVYDAIWQFPVVLAPLGTTESTETVILRPVESTDAMTAKPYELPGSVMMEISKSIESNPQIEFCLYDITQKPPGTIEWE